MARPWLKIHREMLSNPRYGKQPAEVRLAFYELLLLTEDDGTLPDLEQCAWALRWDEDALESAIGTLTSVGWLLDDGDALRWAKWGDYQAESPGAERVRRHRARKRADCNAPVTPVTDNVTPVTDSVTREVEVEVDKKRGEGEETLAPARVRETPPPIEIKATWSEILRQAEEGTLTEESIDDPVAVRALYSIGGPRALRKAINNDRQEDFLRADFVDAYQREVQA